MSTASEIAGLSLRHFQRLIEKDQVPLVKINRKHFITTAEFKAWRRKAKR